jgi:hypothetical protein
VRRAIARGQRGSQTALDRRLTVERDVGTRRNDPNVDGSRAWRR